MSSPRVFLSSLLFSLAATTAQATTFIEIPTDTELIERSQMIATAKVEGSYVQPGREGGFETVYEMRVARGLKGAARPGDLVRVVSPGGEMGQFGSYVPGAAHFTNGESVLMLLGRDGDRWEFTDFSLGAFKFAIAANGEGVLVRELDGVSTLEDGEVVEPARNEARFLRFIEETLRGGSPVPDYDVRAVIGRSSDGGGATSRNLQAASESVADPKRFTQMGASAFGVRWSTAAIGAGINFFKSTLGDLPGAGDGGVSVIQAALAAWTNDCPSAVVLNYAGTSGQNYGSTTPEFFNVADGVNVVRYNDASTPAAGQAQIVFFSTDGGAAGSGFRQIIDADVRVNSSITSASLGLPTIVTHELGHGIGWRHSNATPASPNDSATTCNSGTDDCVSNENGAIMLWRVTNAGNGHVLQPWDTRAVGAVYPGGSCVALGPPSGLVATGGTSNVTLSWTAGTGTPTGYKVYRRAAGGAATFLGSPVGIVTNYTDNMASSGNAYVYYVTATAAGSESSASNSDFATVYSYTDATITEGVTSPKAAHINELRSTVNALRALAGQSPATWTTDPTIAAGSTTIQKAHIVELRDKMDSARSSVDPSVPPFTYSDSTITQGATPIRKTHIEDLRRAAR